jgi:hypothetical protein
MAIELLKTHNDQEGNDPINASNNDELEGTIETVDDALSSIAGGFAALFIAENLAKGRTVEIPSLQIKITSRKKEPENVNL